MMAGRARSDMADPATSPMNTHFKGDDFMSLIGELTARKVLRVALF